MFRNMNAYSPVIRKHRYERTVETLVGTNVKDEDLGVTIKAKITVSEQ